MYTIKGAWVGQTFALGKSNDSAAKRSYTRRSKEERKEIAESFIKKYQRLNNGKFPSISDTKKAVGGSFYCIREIVREIIQENRVLGPAKSLPEEQNDDHVLEQYPLGTIATEPQSLLSVMPNGSVILNQHKSTAEEPDVVLNGSSAESEKDDCENGRSINGSHVSLDSEQSNKPIVVQASVETEKCVERVAASKVTKMTDVVVETFPIRPVTRSMDYLDENSGEIRDTKANVEKNSEKVKLGGGEDSALPNRASTLVNDKEAKNLTGQLLEGNSALLDGKAEENLADPLSVSSNSSATKDGSTNETVETEVANGSISNFNQAKTAYGDDASSNLTTQEVGVGNMKTDTQHGNNCFEESSPTLDRIDLESWKGASRSRNPTKPETNPLLAFFKSFVDGFLKFWSE